MLNSHWVISALFLVLLQPGCSQRGLQQSLRQSVPSSPVPTQLLAVYEPWFGHPSHISVGYSSQDPAVIRKQMDEAKAYGITGFVVDWYGDREPFIDRAYARMQAIAAEKDFHIAMMYDETNEDEGATDEALADFNSFQNKYLSEISHGRQAYLSYNGRPIIFIFPKGRHTDWNRVRESTSTWNPAPLLIYENDPGSYPAAFDGLYAWINPGKPGWAADGSNWGEEYLEDFYQRMQSKYPDKIAVGAAWAGFDDSKASWSLNRHISQRCGQTFADTMKLGRQYAAEHPLPFLVIATWNDYEEGSAIERRLTKCEQARDPLNSGKTRLCLERERALERQLFGSLRTNLQLSCTLGCCCSRNRVARNFRFIPQPNWRGHGHGGIHVARAGSGAEVRCAHGSLLVWTGAL